MSGEGKADRGASSTFDSWIEAARRGDAEALGRALEPFRDYLLLVANQDSNSIVVFRIDPNTGRLKPTGQTLEVPTPVCVTFLPLP